MLFDKRRTGKSVFGLLGNVLDIAHRGMHALGIIEQIECIADYKDCSVGEILPFKFKDCLGHAKVVSNENGQLYLEVVELRAINGDMLCDEFGHEYESRGNIDV